MGGYSSRNQNQDCYKQYYFADNAIEVTLLSTYTTTLGLALVAMMVIDIAIIAKLII